MIYRLLWEQDYKDRTNRPYLDSSYTSDSLSDLFLKMKEILNDKDYRKLKSIINIVLSHDSERDERVYFNAKNFHVAVLIYQENRKDGANVWDVISRCPLCKSKESLISFKSSDLVRA